MASNRRRNKIDVAIDLQQKTLEAMNQFTSDFGASVDRLASMIEGVAGQTGEGGGAGKLGPNASTSAGAQQAMRGVQQARMGGVSTSGAGSGGFGGGVFMNRGNASMPPGDISAGGGGEFERDYIEATKRIGEGVPTNLRQALGYYAAGQLQANPLSPLKPGAENDAIAQQGWSFSGLRDPEYRRAVAQRANATMFNLQASKAMAMNLMGKYTGFFGDVQNIGNAGYATNANDSRQGLFGSQLFSQTFWHGLSEGVWKPALASDFGFSTNYSFAQAQAARRAINEYGWSGGNQGDYLAGILKGNTVNYGLDPQTQMAFLDPMLRWGGDPFSRIMTTLQQIPKAATAAGYNLQQFTQELVSTATQVAQATGQPVGQVASTISSISAVTGLAPQQVGAMDTFQNQLIAAGLSGKSLGQVVLGNQGQALLKQPLKMLAATLGGQGYTVKKWMHDYYHGTAAEKKRAEDAYAYGPYAMFNSPGGKEAFGGMSPMQLIHMVGTAGSGGALTRQSHILDVLSNPQDLERGAHTTAQFNAHVENLIRSYFPHNKSRTDAMIKAYEEQAALKGNPGDKAKIAADLLEKYAPYDRRRFSNMTLGLTPQAQKLVALMNQDAAHANMEQAIGRSPYGQSYGGK